MKNLLLLAFSLFSAYSFSQCACCAGAGVGSSNGDFSTGILTMPKHKWLVEAYADYREIKSGDVVEEDEKLLESIFVSTLGARYGVTDNFTVSALMPYVFLYTADGDDSGFGDMIVLGTYKVYSADNFNLALQGGLELPTGIQKDSNFDNTTVVVGSGSYDPMAGLIMSKTWDKFALQGNVLHKFTTKGFEDNYYGSLNTHNLTLAYKVVAGGGFCPSDLSTSEPGASDAASAQKNSEPSNVGLSVFTGYYGEWLDKIKEDNVVDEDSGHYLGFLSLGTNLSYGKWSFPVTFSLPVVNNVNGEQNEAGYRIRVGVLRSF